MVIQNTEYTQFSSMMMHAEADIKKAVLS